MSPSERFKDATREELEAVAAAADRLTMAQSEFGLDNPGAWEEYSDALDSALIHCPGSRLHSISKEVQVS